LKIFLGVIFMANFSDRLKELRNKKGITQRQMAEIFEMTERNYQRLEATDTPSNETLIKFADFFEVPTDYLLGRDRYWQNADGHIVVKVTPDIFSANDIKKLIKKTDKKKK
jgi:transcriptional regulator with XRE-family HTH domain